MLIKNRASNDFWEVTIERLLSTQASSSTLRFVLAAALREGKASLMCGALRVFDRYRKGALFHAVVAESLNCPTADSIEVMKEAETLEDEATTTTTTETQTHKTARLRRRMILRLLRSENVDMDDKKTRLESSGNLKRDSGGLCKGDSSLRFKAEWCSEAAKSSKVSATEMVSEGRKFLAEKGYLVVKARFREQRRASTTIYGTYAVDLNLSDFDDTGPLSGPFSTRLRRVNVTFTPTEKAENVPNSSGQLHPAKKTRDEECAPSPPSPSSSSAATPVANSSAQAQKKVLKERPKGSKGK